jgi:D-alanyl-lipoteichoic acid acyltransferase DltB (MBOAT superfamily)
VDYTVGIRVYQSNNEPQRKRWLMLSLVINLGILGFFKYFNFFSDSLLQFALGIGWSLDPFTLNIVLPVGISFYTFQTLSYTIDIYRKTLKPTTRFLDFALFVSFFPQLFAGPIERAKTLLPQVLNKRQITLDMIKRGCVLILLGFFKKLVIADGFATVANYVFQVNNPTGLEVILGSYAFAFQIYGDFSGYSDIARGLSKIMGFNLCLNFNLPYFSTNPSEFWKRWHISLSSWLRDYLYIPLGGNR